jgi:hypothetical protein
MLGFFSWNSLVSYLLSAQRRGLTSAWGNAPGVLVGLLTSAESAFQSTVSPLIARRFAAE